MVCMWFVCGNFDVLPCVKGHTHWAIHNHANRIFDRLPVGMRHWNVHV